MEPQSPIATHPRWLADAGRTATNESLNTRILNQTKACFNKDIPAGRYKGGYTDAGVLLIHWQDDDLGCREEIEGLEKVFKEQYGFETKIYEIPSEKSNTALQMELANWAHRYNGSNKLSIIYYGGHGFVVEGDQEALGLAGNQTSDPQQKAQARAHTFFDMFLLLDKPNTDTLLIVDCCYAARSFQRKEVGKRKFELLSSVAPNTEAMGPRHLSSFTKTLCSALEDLYHPSGFSTSRLYRKLYHEQPIAYKPFLFDQSPKNYGRIWIRPLVEGANTGAKDSKIWIDLRLTMDELPTEATMADLAASMQYLPNVQSILFEYLHAPEKQLKLFLDTVAKAQLVRPVVRQLYRRVQQRNLCIEKKNKADQSIEDNENLTTWDGTYLQWRDGTVDEVDHGRISRRGTQTSEVLNGTGPQKRRYKPSLNLSGLRSMGMKMKKGIVKGALHMLHPPVKAAAYVVSIQLQFAQWLRRSLEELQQRLKP